MAQRRPYPSIYPDPALLPSTTQADAVRPAPLPRASLCLSHRWRQSLKAVANTPRRWRSWASYLGDARQTCGSSAAQAEGGQVGGAAAVLVELGFLLWGCT